MPKQRKLPETVNITSDLLDLITEYIPPEETEETVKRLLEIFEKAGKKEKDSIVMDIDNAIFALQEAKKNLCGKNQT